jgi:hypothetical protein
MTKKETIALRYYTALTEANGSSFNDSDVSYLASHRSAAWLEEKATEAEKALEKKRFNDKYGHEPKVYDVVIGDGSRKIC